MTRPLRRIHINAASGERGFTSDSVPDSSSGQSPFLETSGRVAAVGLFVLALIAGLYFGRYLMMPITAAVILGMTLGPVIDFLQRRFLPAPVGSALVVGGGLIAVTAIFYGLALPLEQWSARLPQVWDEVRADIRHLQGPLEEMQEMEEAVEEAVSDEDDSVEVTIKRSGVVTNTVSAAPAAIARFFIFLGALYFFLAYRRALRESVLRLCVRQRLQLRLARIFRDVERFLSRYIISIAAINLGFGVAVGLVMYLLGVPSPHLWGVLAAILNFIPYAGPAFMTIILIGVGIAEFETLGRSLAPALAFLAVNFLEAQFVTPTILGRTLTLNPFLIILSLSFWIWLWGPIGGFLAVPLFLIVKTAIFRTTMGTAYLKTPEADEEPPAPEARPAPVRAPFTPHPT